MGGEGNQTGIAWRGKEEEGGHPDSLGRYSAPRKKVRGEGVLESV